MGRDSRRFDPVWLLLNPPILARNRDQRITRKRGSPNPLISFFHDSAVSDVAFWDKRSAAHALRANRCGAIGLAARPTRAKLESHVLVRKLRSAEGSNVHRDRGTD